MRKLIAKLTLKDGYGNIQNSSKCLQIKKKEQFPILFFHLQEQHLQFQICNVVGEGLCFQITLMNTKTIDNCCPLL
jgi:hypothetical protein